MSKAVMISIRPEWCEKIGSGEKTIEVRKTRPKLPTPFKCYIYETQGKKYKGMGIYDPDAPLNKNFLHYPGKVIGEFTCDAIYTVDAEHSAYLREAFDGIPSDEFLQQARLTAYDLLDYLAAEATSKVEYVVGYGWHITDLVIYGEPKPLTNFCTGSSRFTYDDEGKLTYTGMKRPPQSWCYVEEL